jgi:Domain of unknown function (DUF5666)
MNGLVSFLRGKTALAILGVVIFGGSAAYFAAGSVTERVNPTASRQPQTSGTTTTQPRSPTPVPSAGLQVDIHGTVTQVNTSANQFTVLVITGFTTNVAVNSQTTFEGASTSLRGLQTGWSVDVAGVYQADGSLLANDVSSHRHA